MRRNVMNFGQWNRVNEQDEFNLNSTSISGDDLHDILTRENLSVVYVSSNGDVRVIADAIGNREMPGVADSISEDPGTIAYLLRSPEDYGVEFSIKGGVVSAENESELVAVIDENWLRSETEYLY